MLHITKPRPILMSSSPRYAARIRAQHSCAFARSDRVRPRRRASTFDSECDDHTMSNRVYGVPWHQAVPSHTIIITAARPTLPGSQHCEAHVHHAPSCTRTPGVQDNDHPRILLVKKARARYTALKGSLHASSTQKARSIQLQLVRALHPRAQRTHIHAGVQNARHDIMQPGLPTSWRILYADSPWPIGLLARGASGRSSQAKNVVCNLKLVARTSPMSVCVPDPRAPDHVSNLDAALLPAGLGQV
ncbi:hypothetical protein C8Q70DRAFT_568907 [Cubamyces menziesii]|nr:hypothetical protein C8Q70DRAFT_568907 [Cubamyces menziesii]